MASPKVVPTNLDLPRQSSTCSLSSVLADLHHHLHHNDDPSKTSPTISMDELLKFIYSSSEPEPDPDFQAHDAAASSLSRQGSLSLPKEMAFKTVDEVWKEIVEGSDQRLAGAEEEGLEKMTLEDFLTKAGAVREEDVRGVSTATGSYHADAAAPVTEGFEDGIDGSVVGVVAVGSKRGKRRAVEEPIDKATIQKQKRMIKNRESAARSRERKQAYTVELESLVTQLEEEKERLLKEEADIKKQRLKQLRESLIPVVEKRGHRPPLRRVNSGQW